MAGCNFMSDLTRRYVTRTNTNNTMDLTPTEGWTVIKAIGSLLTFISKAEGVQGVKWKGLSLTSESFANKLDSVGIGTLNLEPPTQTPRYLGMIHSIMLERVPNSLELLRTVDNAIQEDSEDGKRLMAVNKLMGIDDPILAVKALCEDVIQVVTYKAEREKLGHEITSHME